MRKDIGSFAVRKGSFWLNGERFQILCGELHYPRIPRGYWRHRIRMAKAMGLNTVCAYLFWNHHEGKPGVFDFSGEKDVAAFVRMCQEEGMWVLLRPGPYACAEWDFGGLPWWLLKDSEMRVRCSYGPFVSAAQRWIKRVGKELAPLQVTRGGPILMVQVENEYGAFGNDQGYLAALTETLRKSGFEVPLMRCDWANPEQLLPGTIPLPAGRGVTTSVNFGSNPQKNIGGLGEAYPGAPKFCSEFWMGWFDQWGFPRQGKDRADGVAHGEDLKWMFENKVSVSLYMFHGGTNFGFSSGANQYERYDPYVTTYDYWAPLTEQGRPREKYFKFREIIGEATGRVLPEVPEVVPIGEVGPFEMTEAASVFGNLPRAREAVFPQPMEMFDQAHGAILYRTDLEGRAAGEGELKISEVHDVAQVYMNGELLGTLERRLGQQALKIKIPEKGPAVLDILVWALGRVNFGPDMMDRKGITRYVTFNRLTLFNWEVYCLPLDKKMLGGLKFKKKDVKGEPVFFRGTVEVKAPVDTYLDMRGWGKGHVWVNGRHLGRYWKIGPQQTLYWPGVWMKKGRNEVVVLDLENETGCRRLKGVAEGVLDEVTERHPEAPVE